MKGGEACQWFRELTAKRRKKWKEGDRIESYVGRRLGRAWYRSGEAETAAGGPWLWLG